MIAFSRVVGNGPKRKGNSNLAVAPVELPMVSRLTAVAIGVVVLVYSASFCSSADWR